ncbi:hypothetical protein Tsubulata_036390 [Turnera subulata]|uniref:Uncharacterized protein n=1 Tax=Turnera subulata TaxID=218843 RepID=A0A9Q0J6K1_9ROSI|nr:hypothetical protein Tsubulata_036390 [Turnera subulata]
MKEGEGRSRSGDAASAVKSRAAFIFALRGRGGRGVPDVLDLFPEQPSEALVGGGAGPGLSDALVGVDAGKETPTPEPCAVEKGRWVVEEERDEVVVGGGVVEEGRDEVVVGGGDVEEREDGKGGCVGGGGGGVKKKGRGGGGGVWKQNLEKGKRITKQ